MIKLVYLATPQIAVNTFMKLLNFNNIDIVAVVTQPDRPQGRKMVITPPPIKEYALNNNIEVFQTKSIRKDEALIKKLKELEPDFFITFAFGQILSQEVLDIPKIGTINVHASLLPQYRGANPIQHSIVNGDKKTGVTTMLTSLGLDEGDICMQEEIDITDNMTDIELREKISEISPFVLYPTIMGLYNKTLNPQKQDANLATYANKFQKTDGYIDFSDTAQNIHNKVRGLLSWPCCYFEHENKKIKILSTEIYSTTDIGDIGTIKEISKNGISVYTKSGSILLKEIQPESKNKMSAYAWNNSAKLKIGDKI